MTEEKAVYEVAKICKSCGKPFTPYRNDDEKKFFEENGLVEPKRCRKCRFWNKVDKHIDERIKKYLKKNGK